MPPLTPMPQAPAPQNNAHPYSDQNYAKPASSFPNVLAPYRVRNVPAPNLSNSARTDQLFRDGKIYLSINDAVAMALENNLDIVLQRYNLSIADTDLLRTKSGCSDWVFLREWCRARPAAQREHPLEVPAFLLERLALAPGGTQLALAARARARADLVGSTFGGGPPLSSYDPVLTGTIQGERAATPQANLFFSGGAPTVVQNTNTYNFGYTQAFATGTTANVSFNNSRITTNIPYRPFESTDIAGLPVSIDPAPAARLWLRSQPALDPDCPQYSREWRRRVSPADYRDRLASRKHLLGPGDCVRGGEGERARAATGAEDAVRQRRAGQNWHAGAHHVGASPKRSRNREAEPDYFADPTPASSNC